MTNAQALVMPCQPMLNARLSSQTSHPVDSLASASIPNTWTHAELHSGLLTQPLELFTFFFLFSIRESHASHQTIGIRNEQITEQESKLHSASDHVYDWTKRNIRVTRVGVDQPLFSISPKSVTSTHKREIQDGSGLPIERTSERRESRRSHDAFLK